MSRIKRLEAIEERLLRPRLDVESLRQFTDESIANIAAAQLDGLAEHAEVRVCDGTYTQQSGESLEAFKERVLRVVHEAVMTEPMPLQGLSRFYRLLPRWAAGN